MHIALTGAASGIGAQTAQRLKARGHEITAFDIHEPPAHVDRWVQTDFADPDSIRAALAQADGTYDALVNNAGIPPRGDNAVPVLAINFLGLRQFMDGVLDRLAPGASIVNTSSRAGSAWRENLDEVKALMALETPDQLAGFVAGRGIDATRAYNLSKEAVIVLTLARTEPLLARGLRINSVCPSAVATGILDDFILALGERAKTSIARVGRAGDPGEIAELICFLASPESGWLRGQNIMADGGISAMVDSDLLGLSRPSAG